MYLVYFVISLVLGAYLSRKLRFRQKLQNFLQKNQGDNRGRAIVYSGQSFDTKVGCLTFIFVPIGITAYALQPRWFTFAKISPSPVLFFVALILLTSGIVLYIKSIRELGGSFVGGVGLYEDHVLVTSGVYRWVRNPIYIAYFLAMFGLGLAVFNAAMLFLLLFPILLMMMRIPGEERILENRFGSEYVDYKSQAGRFMPRIRRPGKRN